MKAEEFESFVSSSKSLSTSSTLLNVIHRDPPSTIVHWLADKHIDVETFCDASLAVANKLVGSFDLSAHYLAKKNLYLGTSYHVMNPGVVVIGSNGKVLHKFVCNQPGEC